MSNGNHIPENLPMVLLGDLGVAGRPSHQVPGTTPLANLHTTVLQRSACTWSGCTTRPGRWTCRR